MKTETTAADATKTGNSNVQHEPTTERVTTAAHEAIDQAATRADGVERELRTRATRAGEKFEATQDRAAKQVDQSVSTVESFVKGRPIAAAGIAFAAGVLATALLRR